VSRDNKGGETRGVKFGILKLIKIVEFMFV
jgi:hypothetical protein